MKLPSDLKYSKDHLWVKMTEEGKAEIGLTDHAQEALGAIVSLELPDEGTALTAGEPLGEVESVKLVSDIVAPLSGTACRVNEALAEEPEAINEKPYESRLLTICGPEGADGLMSAAEYEAFCGQPS